MKRIIFLILIAVVLAGVGWFAVKGKKFLAEQDRASGRFEKTDMTSLVLAVRNYKKEYLRLPKLTASDAEFTETKGRVLEILLGENQEANPRGVRFWSPPNETAGQKNAAGVREFRDIHGNFYRLYVDTDDDGKLPNPAKGQPGQPDEIKFEVLLYSAGPDGKYETWADNLRSWE
jgi:hypothetical protein